MATLVGFFWQAEACTPGLYVFDRRDAAALSDLPDVSQSDVVDAGSPVAIPRLVSPSSGAAVTSTQPTLRWTLPAGSMGTTVVVELCRDRACTQIIESIDASGAAARPTSALAPGVVFWRAFGVLSGVRSAMPSPVWTFIAPRRDTGRDTAAPATADFDGDGIADVVVAAPDAASANGKVYVYRGRALGVASAPTATLTGTVSGGTLGAAVAAAGDVNGDGYGDLVAGTPGNDGGVVVFLGSADGISLTGTLIASPMTGASGFGASVAGSGDTDGDGYADVVVGAPNSDGQAGRAFLFRGGPLGLIASPAVTFEGPGTAMGHFGAVVDGAGDVNGDGLGDVIVSAPGAANDIGQVRVFLGAASGPGAGPSATLGATGPMAGDLFGTSLANSDVNGDGFSDVVVGAPGRSNLWVFAGSTAGLPATSAAPALTSSGSGFGRALGAAGDVNRDGFADVVAGSPGSGRAEVFAGGASGLVATVMATVSRADTGFGAVVGGVGDSDGDGFADIAVGAPGGNGAFLYGGGSSGLRMSPSASLVGPDGGMFGSALALVRRPGAPYRLLSPLRIVGQRRAWNFCETARF